MRTQVALNPPDDSLFCRHYPITVASALANDGAIGAHDASRIAVLAGETFLQTYEVIAVYRCDSET